MQKGKLQIAVAISVYALCVAGTLSASQLSRQMRRKEAIRAKLYGQEEEQIEAAQQKAEAEKQARRKSFESHYNRQKRAGQISQWQQLQKEEKLERIASGAYAHCYERPIWPVESDFSYSPQVFDVNYSYTWASSAHSKHGQYGDLSVLRLGTDRPQVKDMLLAAKLAQHEATTSFQNGYWFMKHMGDVKVEFNAREEMHKIDMSFRRSFFNDRWSIGVQAPVIHAQRRLSFRPHVDADLRTTLFALEEDPERDASIRLSDINRLPINHGTVSEFLEDVFRDKKSTYHEHLYTTQISDITFFTHIQFQGDYISRSFVGATVTLPYTTQSENDVLYPINLGTQGFMTAKVFASLMSKKIAGWTPNMYVSCEIGLPAKVKRRTPRVFTFNTRDDVSSQLVLGDSIQDITVAKLTSNDRKETPYASFAAQETEVRIRPGVATTLRAGATYRGVFGRPDTQFAWYYQFFFRTAQSVLTDLAQDVWDTSAHELNRHELRHDAGMRWTWQPWNGIDLSIGGNAVVGGNNIPQEFSVFSKLLYQF